MRTIGIEEELFLVDPATGELTAVAQSAVESQAATAAETTIELELYQQQIELATAPETDLGALRRRLVEARTAVVAAAGAAGAAAVAMPVPVLSVPRHPDLTPDELAAAGAAHPRMHDERLRQQFLGVGDAYY